MKPIIKITGIDKNTFFDDLDEFEGDIILRNDNFDPEDDGFEIVDKHRKIIS